MVAVPQDDRHEEISSVARSGLDVAGVLARACRAGQILFGHIPAELRLCGPRRAALARRMIVRGGGETGWSADVLRRLRWDLRHGRDDAVHHRGWLTPGRVRRLRSPDAASGRGVSRRGCRRRACARCHRGW
uniref:hypothetical protein n=1 Tax=Amycolatopsis sp. CA-096443 TaxID=3239919 RepID=UPI003F49AE56